MQRSLCYLLLCTAVLSSCEGILKERARTAATLVTGEGVRFSPPRSRGGDESKEKWTTIPRPDGIEYAVAKSGPEDVVTFYGFTTPLAPEIKTIEQLETLLKTEGKFEVLRRDQISGVAVLRFSKLTNDGDSNLPERLRSGLGLSPRPAQGPWATRTTGAFFLKPGDKPKMVTLACARLSQHGEIGEYYEMLLEDYLASFTADNLMR